MHTTKGDLLEPLQIEIFHKSIMISFRYSVRGLSQQILVYASGRADREWSSLWCQTLIGGIKRALSGGQVFQY